MHAETIVFGHDVTFVMTVESKGWILERIANEIASALEAEGKLVTKYWLYRGNRLHRQFPRTGRPFFMHYAHFVKLIDKIKPKTLYSPIVWFTHFDKKHGISVQELVQKLVAEGADVICPCSDNERLLIAGGMPSEKVTTAFGGFDESWFGANCGAGDPKKVAFVSGCYSRKRPELLLEIAEQMHDYQFRIVGPTAGETNNSGILWSQGPYRERISEARNVELWEVPYSEYRPLISECGMYLMTSDYEGGPIGLMEAMALGLVPIATRTGFVPDLMTGDLRDLIMPVGPTRRMIARRIQLAYRAHKRLSAIARSRVEGCTWSSFANRCARITMSQDGCDIGQESPKHVLSSSSETWGRKEVLENIWTSWQLERGGSHENAATLLDECGKRTNEPRLKKVALSRARMARRV